MFPAFAVAGTALGSVAVLLNGLTICPELLRMHGDLRGTRVRVQFRTCRMLQMHMECCSCDVCHGLKALQSTVGRHRALIADHSALCALQFIGDVWHIVACSCPGCRPCQKWRAAQVAGDTTLPATIAAGA